MSDTGNLFSGFFFPGAGGQGISKELRQRIALAMLAQKRKYPTTFGEGLSAIGESLGEMGTMRRLAAEEGASFAGGNAKADELLGVTPPGAGAPPPDRSPIAATPSPEDQTPVPPTVQEGGPPVPPRPVLRPNAPVRSAAMPPLPPAAPAAPLPPDQQQSYAPDAPVRMPTAEANADWRAQNPLPPGLPPVPGASPPGAPQQPGGARPSVADFGQKLALAPTSPPAVPPPSFAAPISQYDPQSDPRRAIALAMMRNGQAGQPQPSTFRGPPPADAAPPPAAAVPPPAAPPPPAPPPPNQGISAAPSAAPIRSAPLPPAGPQSPPGPPPVGPQPGYVSQPLKPAIAPMPEPMGPHEAELRNAIARDPDGMNGQLGKRLAPVIQMLETNRNAIYQRNVEKYKIDLAAEIARNQKIEEQKTGAAKDVAEVANTQARTRKEGVVENPEEKYIMGPDNVVRPIRVEGENPNAMPSGKLTEDQRKTLVYHGWAKSGNQAITGNDQLLAHGLYQEALGKIPGFGNAAQDAEYRRAKNGADNFILSFMRSTSGAQYGATERLDHAKAMLPKLGDDPQTLADKAAARQQFIDSEYAGLGKQGQKMADYLAKSYDPGSSENKQRLIDIEMQGVKGSEIGEVKTNKNPKSPHFGQQRMWNGSRWVEH